MSSLKRVHLRGEIILPPLLLLRSGRLASAASLSLSLLLMQERTTVAILTHTLLEEAAGLRAEIAMLKLVIASTASPASTTKAAAVGAEAVGTKATWLAHSVASAGAIHKSHGAL